MISPYQLLRESGFSQYKAMVRFKYDRENTSLGAEKLAEMVRAIPGSTRVSTVSLDKTEGIAIFSVKLISAKTPKQAFMAFKENALSRFRGLLLSVEVGAGTIEKKGDFIVQENKRSRTHLGDYLGQLIEEGLLLEVSIDELRRQYLECDPPKLTPEVFEQIVQACENKSNYATWLCKKVATGLINTEDLELWHEIFTFFERYKQRFEKKDINQVKTTEDINAFMTDYQRVQDEVEHKKMTGSGKKEEKPEKKGEEEPLEEGQVGFLTTSDGRVWKVYNTKPGQYALERKIGSGTSWCTVSSPNYFNAYMTDPRYQRDGKSPDPNYYIFVSKEDPKTKYQIHISSDQCKDRTDQEVNYSLPFIQEFYKYLHDKLGVQPSAGAEGGAKVLQFANTLESEVKKLGNVEVNTVSVVGGEASGILVDGSDENTIYATAQLAKALDCDIKLAGTLILSLLTGGRGSIQPHNLRNLGFGSEYIYAVKAGNTKDVVTWKKVGYSPGVNLLGSLLSDGTDITISNSVDFKTNLPRADINNIDTYKDIAAKLGVRVKLEVALRNDKSLPNLKHYRVKVDGSRRLYEFPADKESVRARLEAGMNSYSVITAYKERDGFAPIKCYIGPECVGDRGPVQINDNAWYFERWYTDFSEEGLKSLWPIIDFVGVTNTTGNRWVNTSLALKELGGSMDNFLKDAEKCPNVPIEGSSYKLYSLSPELKKIFVALQGQYGYYPNFEKFTISGEFLIFEYQNHIYFWEPKKNVVGVESVGTRTLAKEANMPLDDLVKFYIAAGGSLEDNQTLSKLAARASGVTTTTVPKYLRKHDLQRYSLPISSTNTVTATGVYGSWDQLKDLIRYSSDSLYKKVQEVQNEANTKPSDVLLYWYNDDSVYGSWNATIRYIKDGQVVAYAKKTGSANYPYMGGGVVRDNLRVPAGDLPTSNYQVDQPRQPRQARAAAQQAQGEAPAQNLEGLDNYRANSQHSQELYFVNPEHVREVLEQAGFTNLAAAFGEDHRKRAIIYRAYDHGGGNISYVAIICGGNGPTVVAGYPNNPSYIEASNNSTQWRRLTRELDNSTRTFQQCVDVCNERHIPLPTALQGWLAYRGVQA